MVTEPTFESALGIAMMFGQTGVPMHFVPAGLVLAADSASSAYHDSFASSILFPA